MVSIKSIFENPDAEKIDKEDLSAVKNRIRDLWNSQKNAVNNVGSAEDTALFHIVSMLLSADKNCAFSPTSLLCALLFLGRLTEGTCQKEIYDTLFCTPETAEQMYRNIMDSTTGHSGIASSTIVASLWSNHNYPLKERELYKICEQYGVDAYSGKMGSADMNLALQGWVNRHTGRMLTSYTSGMKIDSLSVLELIIAACFKAAWEVPFWERQTKCGDFHIDNNQTVPCMFMNGKEKNRCYRGKMFAAAVKELQLDYQMWFLIPNEEIDLTAIASDPATISFLINPQDVEMEEYEIAFSVPKFDVASKTDIKAVMNDMGIYAVFNENTADFSAISDTRELYLSKVEHATKIKIMEDGVEAASYMDFGVAAAGLPQKIREISFVLDRPFLFAITKGGRVPVYVGTIINPNNKQ